MARGLNEEWRELLLSAMTLGFQPYAPLYNEVYLDEVAAMEMMESKGLQHVVSYQTGKAVDVMERASKLLVAIRRVVQEGQDIGNWCYTYHYVDMLTTGRRESALLIGFAEEQSAILFKMYWPD